MKLFRVLIDILYYSARRYRLSIKLKGAMADHVDPQRLCKQHSIPDKASCNSRAAYTSCNQSLYQEQRQNLHALCITIRVGFKTVNSVRNFFALDQSDIFENYFLCSIDIRLSFIIIIIIIIIIDRFILRIKSC